MARDVYKFGGTSVGSAERIAGVAAIVNDAVAAGTEVVVVTSAMGGVTSALVAAGEAARTGDRAAATAAVEALQERHEHTAMALLGRDDPALRTELRRLTGEAGELLRAACLLEELTARSRDRLLATGEKLAARLVAAALRSVGRSAEALDADTFLDTDDRFGEASPIGGAAERHIRAAVLPVLEGGTTPVVTGFCGRAPDGATSTLGRGGSDLSATLLAAALPADSVTIWTDVDGVFSADPRLVSEARVIEHLNYREAAEMSYYGAKVLHPRTMIPVMRARIPVHTRNSFHPERPGTRVDAQLALGSHPVKGITAVRAQALVSVEGNGMAGVPGIAGTVFTALATSGVSVTMISQSSSEASICLAVPEASVNEALRVLKRATLPLLARGAIEEVVVRRGVALVAMVGLGMAHQPGVAGRGLQALADGGTNVLAIAQGSSELNLTVAVDEADVASALRQMHQAFGLGQRDTGRTGPSGFDVVLLGCGNIGRALLNALLDDPAGAFERRGRRPTVVGIADRSGFVLEPRGLSVDRLRGLVAAKAEGRSLVDEGGRTGAAVDLVREALQWRLSNPVVVDVSDAADAEDALVAALEGHAHVVTANKRPLAGPRFAELRTLARDQGRELRAEATVGAGLPVVDTLEMLLQTGDRLRQAQGCFSGTLGFVMGRVQQGAPLSVAVSDAIDAGLTEPDPVQDLCGADVARKAVILGRWAGWDGSEVALEGLVPADWSGTPIPQLLERLCAELDGPFAARVQAAQERGEVLRYVAHLTSEATVVGPRSVPATSPLGQLRGTDNLVLFHTDRYATQPLVIVGPGAGIEVTAMGVLGDMLRIVRGGASW